MCAHAISALLVFQHSVVLTLRQFRIQCVVDDQGLIASGCNTQPDYGGGDRRGGALQGVYTSSTGAEAGAAAVVQKQSTDATRTTKQCYMYVFIEETMTRAWTTPHGITVLHLPATASTTLYSSSQRAAADPTSRLPHHLLWFFNCRQVPYWEAPPAGRPPQASATDALPQQRKHYDQHLSRSEGAGPAPSRDIWPRDMVRQGQLWGSPARRLGGAYVQCMATTTALTAANCFNPCCCCWCWLGPSLLVLLPRWTSRLAGVWGVVADTLLTSRPTGSPTRRCSAW